MVANEAYALWCFSFTQVFSTRPNHSVPSRSQVDKKDTSRIVLFSFSIGEGGKGGKESRTEHSLFLLLHWLEEDTGPGLSSQDTELISKNRK